MIILAMVNGGGGFTMRYLMIEAYSTTVRRLRGGRHGISQPWVQRFFFIVF